MKNAKILNKLNDYLSQPFLIDKKAENEIPSLPLSKHKEADLKYLMYLLRHKYFKGKYDSLVSSLMSATNLVTFKKILSNSKILYNLDGNIEPLIDSLLKDDVSVSQYGYSRISPKVQKGLNELLGANLVEDGILGEKTQSALNEFKQKYGLSSNQEAINKVLFLIENKNNPGY